MIILRGLAVILALIISFVVAMLTQIDLVTVMTIIAFVLVVDDVAWTALSNIYMKAIYQDLENVKWKDKKDDNDSDN